MRYVKEKFGTLVKVESMELATVESMELVKVELMELKLMELGKVELMELYMNLTREKLRVRGCAASRPPWRPGAKRCSSHGTSPLSSSAWEGGALIPPTTYTTSVASCGVGGAAPMAQGCRETWRRGVKGVSPGASSTSSTDYGEEILRGKAWSGQWLMVRGRRRGRCAARGEARAAW